MEIWTKKSICASLRAWKATKKFWNFIKAFTVSSRLHRCGMKNSRKHCPHCTQTLSDGEAFLVVHVDDLLISATSSALIDKLTLKINKGFELKDLGNVKHFLGIDVYRDEQDILVSHNHNTFRKSLKVCRSRRQSLKNSQLILFITSLPMINAWLPTQNTEKSLACYCMCRRTLVQM